MSKLNKIGYYVLEDGTEINKDQYDAIALEDRRNRFVFLDNKFKANTITKHELLELMEYKNKSKAVEILYDSFYKVNMSKQKPDVISDGDYGKFFILLNYISYKNKLEHSNGRPIKKELLADKLKFKNIRSFDNFIKKLSDQKMLGFLNMGGIKFLVINPAYAKHNDFVLYIEIYDLFKNDILSDIKLFIGDIEDKCVFNYTISEIKPLLRDYEYSNLSFKFSEDSYFVYKEPVKDNGIYILYNNNEIIYIGKSNNMQNRINQHKKDKNFDSVKCIVFKDSGNINLYEPYLIQKYKPIYNKDLLEEISMGLPDIILKGDKYE